MENEEAFAFRSPLHRVSPADLARAIGECVSRLVGSEVQCSVEAISFPSVVPFTNAEVRLKFREPPFGSRTAARRPGQTDSLRGSESARTG